MKTEKGALWLSTGAALVVGIVGLVVSQITNSQAILLDGAFNIVYFLAALLTLWVARLAALPDSDQYPLGYTYFEPLMNGLKGLLIMGLSMFALFDAVSSILIGGRVISVGPAIGYGVFATLACGGSALLLKRAHRNTGSPLVGADAASWTVNAVISGAVLLVFAVIPAVKAAGWFGLVPYVDPVLVSIMVTISLVVPIRMAWRALMAMLNRAPMPEARKPIEAAVRAALKELPARKITVRMIQPGRRLVVVAFVLLPKAHKVGTLATFDRLRAKAEAAVRAVHGENAVVDIVFTARPELVGPRRA